MLDKQGDLRIVDRVERAYAPERTYNFTVAGSHTFFADGVWVHNCGIEDLNKIASGHAWTKHAVDWQKLGLSSSKELAEYLGRVQAGGVEKVLENGRIAWFDEAKQVVLIFNPKSADKGSAFIPKAAGIDYFNALK